MNVERAGRIILDEVCDGNPNKAIQLMTATRRGLIESAQLTDKNSAQLDTLIAWFTMVRDYSDEALIVAQLGEGGYARAAGYLLELPIEQRQAAEGEAQIMTNMSPGWRYADAVYEVVRRFVAGDTRTPLTERNSQWLAIERARRSI